MGLCPEAAAGHIFADHLSLRGPYDDSVGRGDRGSASSGFPRVPGTGSRDGIRPSPGASTSLPSLPSLADLLKDHGPVQSVPCRWCH